MGSAAQKLPWKARNETRGQFRAGEASRLEECATPRAADSPLPAKVRRAVEIVLSAGPRDWQTLALVVGYPYGRRLREEMGKPESVASNHQQDSN
jgi:hypothetical protein